MSKQKELADLGQTLLGNPLSDELKVDGKQLNIFWKSLSTPISRSAILGIICAFVVLIGFIATPDGLWKNIFGLFFFLVIIATLAFTFLGTWYKPQLAESDIKSMFILIVNTIGKSLEMRTQMDGQTIEDANLETLTQPVELVDTVTMKDSVQVELIKGKR